MGSTLKKMKIRTAKISNKLRKNLKQAPRLEIMAQSIII